MQFAQSPIPPPLTRRSELESDGSSVRHISFGVVLPKEQRKGTVNRPGAMRLRGFGVGLRCVNGQDLENEQNRQYEVVYLAVSIAGCRKGQSGRRWRRCKGKALLLSLRTTSLPSSLARLDLMPAASTMVRARVCV
jgi:hypothetical protein